MKLKLRLSKNREKEICDELVSMGVTISEDADLILTEENFHKGELLCKDETDKIVVELSDILYIESIGKIVYVHTKDKIYTTNSRIYELDSLLPDNSFLRISNSVIIT